MLARPSIQRLLLTALSVLLVMVSASIHEFGHAFAAHRLGDDTAKRAGRLTLNPLAHLDPFGSIFLPMIMAMAGGPVFAFAKPVPYNPRNLRNMQRDEVLVALAGPATNLLQAAVGAMACRLVWSRMTLDIVTGGAAYWIYTTLSTYVYVNCSLAFFNLIPLPPLDGSSIVSPLLRGEARRRYYVVQHYSLPILMALLYLVPMMLPIDPLGAYLDVTAGALADLLLGWV